MADDTGFGSGILDFLKTPEGQGVLAAGFGGLAGARRGQPINSLGRAGMAGVLGYENALENQTRRGLLDTQKQQREMQMAEAARRQQALQNYGSTVPQEHQAAFALAPEMYLENQPMFQKQQIVETVSESDPLRTQKMWLRPGEVKGPVAGMGSLPEILDPRVQEAKMRIARAGAGQTNVFNSTKDDFKNERDLRNDFAGLPTSKAFGEVRSAYDQIATSLKSASPAGDLAAATKFMKILDPGSVVRESELGMAMAATGVMDRLQNYAQMTMNGNKLTPKQREDFGNLSKQLYEAAEGRYNQTAEEYRGVASQYNLDPDRIVKPSATAPDKPKQDGKTPMLGGRDKEAWDWANANPNDPRAAQIKQRLTR